MSCPKFPRHYNNPDIEQNFKDKVTRIKNAEQAERESDLKERMAKIDTPKRQSETVVLTR